MANYWTRKDDSSHELDTLNPWEEVLGHGDRVMPIKRYKVVCAIVENEGEYLCVRKGQTKYEYTSFRWEFPGGKIEEGETPQQALSRELLEEMDYRVEVKEELCSVFHEYPDFSIELRAFLCTAKDRSYTLKEHMDSCWLPKGKLDDLAWCEADELLLQTWLGEISL